MEPTLFSFIWKYSKRQQFMLLFLTVASFPFLYASLELPKRIINDAIGSETEIVRHLPIELTQVQFLLVLSIAFLATVIASGLMKMRINTMKGILAERMLRRFRYQLISRMMRFPKPYFQTTSQGELVSMITSEAEPMGGLMGDAIAQPVFQFGQMLTIVFFLFMQSVWFGLASVALIPLQAWLIPKLQRQINLLNKDRIQQVRRLSSEIGETAAGISDLRSNGGWRYRLAQITDRLGNLFEIRFRIYQKKFFMKFLNNLITQMTPFLFYSVGGFLAIRGEITVGALVAALAAYKDLSGPWRELLTYYNQVQDMSLRWRIVTERFAPGGMIPERLFRGEPEEVPHLNGAIEFRGVSVLDQDGNTILEDIDLTIPPGARVAIRSAKPRERAAMAQLLTREIMPTSGEVIVSGHRMNDLHQSVIAARVGHAHSRPYLFDGTVGDNLLMPLKTKPRRPAAQWKVPDRKLIEAVRAGNSTDLLESDWLDPALAGLGDTDDIRDWWFQLVQAMGTDEMLYRRTLRSRLDAERHPGLVAEIVGLRGAVFERIKAAGLGDAIYRFDPEKFNPAVPIGGNLLFAAPLRDIHPLSLASDRDFQKMLGDLGLDDEAREIGAVVIGTLRQTFGRDGIDHPLFRRLGIERDLYLRLLDILERRETGGDTTLKDEERAIIATVPFLLTAEQIGSSFPEEYKEKILEIRRMHGARLRDATRGMFQPLDDQSYIRRRTVIENALFGRVSGMAGARAEEIEDVVADVLNQAGLRQRLVGILYDMQTGLGGNYLPTVFAERAAFSRAAIKRPDILVLDQVLASHDSQSRLRTRQKLRELLPGSIMIFMEDHFAHPEAYDLYVELEDGRMDGVSRQQDKVLGEGGAADLSRKLNIIAGTRLFRDLDPRNQRLLAFSAQWYEAGSGQVIFSHGQQADAAYLCLEGRASLRWPGSGKDVQPVTFIQPGRLIGDLSIITGQRRNMDLVAEEDCRFLRIGAEEFRAVIESDVTVAVHLLETVGRHLAEAGDDLRDFRARAAEFENDPRAGLEPDMLEPRTDA